MVGKRKILALLTFSLICASILTSCGSQSAIAPLPTASAPLNTDIQGRLEKASGLAWEEGRPGNENPDGFIQRLIPSNPEQCNIDVLVFRTKEQASRAKGVINGWGWTTIWEIEDPQTRYGIFIGERAGAQKCTMDAAAAFNATLTR